MLWLLETRDDTSIWTVLVDMEAPCLSTLPGILPGSLLLGFALVKHRSLRIDPAGPPYLMTTLLVYLSLLLSGLYSTPSLK